MHIVNTIHLYKDLFVRKTNSDNSRNMPYNFNKMIPMWSTIIMQKLALISASLSRHIIALLTWNILCVVISLLYPSFFASFHFLSSVPVFSHSQRRREKSESLTHKSASKPYPLLVEHKNIALFPYKWIANVTRLIQNVRQVLQYLRFQIVLIIDRSRQRSSIASHVW